MAAAGLTVVAASPATAAPAIAKADVKPPPGDVTTKALAPPTAGTTPAAGSGLAASALAGFPGPIPPLSSVNPGPDGSVPITRVPSPALQSIPALPAVNPGPDQAPVVEKAPVGLVPPVTPSPITLPGHPGQELVNATAADALATLAAAGRLSGGNPDLDANKLQPQVSSAQFVNPTQPATLQQLLQSLTSGNVPPQLPVDPLALLQALPDGLPRITYRVCSESPTKPVSCSLTLPIGVPALVNVTGDGTPASPDKTPDVLVDLVPAVSVNNIVAAAQNILNLNKQVADVQSTLTALLTLLQNPLYLLTHPGALIQALQLQTLLTDLQSKVQQAIAALVSLVNVGLGLLAVRLPTSEIAPSSPLPAHVWAVYDLPGHKRLSIGFDGTRRGTSLPQFTLGIFTFNPAATVNGVFDVRGELHLSGAGTSLAVTAGLSSVTQDQTGSAFDPTVASIRFQPVPSNFDAHALVDMGFEKAQVDATTDVATQLDALVETNRRSASLPLDRFTELKIDNLPKQVQATLTRPPGGGAATVDYHASSTIAQALFADYEYTSGTTLSRATQIALQSIPSDVFVSLTSTTSAVNVAYQASGQMGGLDAAIYDAAASIVLRGSLRQIPTTASLLADLPARHVNFHGNQPLGLATVALSRNLGPFAPLTGDHATLLTNGSALGVSAQVTGLQSIDAFFDSHPRLTTTFNPGGQPFTAAGIVDVVTKARLDISNLPAQLSIDLDPTARTIAYQASSVVTRVHAAYVNTTAGPSAVAAVNGLPTSLTGSWDLGSKPHVHYKASSSISQVELFASPQGVETLDPNGNDYLSVLVKALPTEADLLVDFPARHIDGTMSAPLGEIVAVARFPLGPRVYAATADLVGVPAHFVADFGDGAFNFQGLTGPLASVNLTVTNHPNPLEPTGVHLAVHLNESTSDFDASAALRNLSQVTYTATAASHAFLLNSDIGADPLAVDANLIRAAGGVDDTQLAAFGHVSGLPTTLKVDDTNGKLTYQADRSIGLELQVRLGKLAALAGLGAPLPANGAALVAKGCNPGAGCATDTSVFCSIFARCLGLVGNLNTPGLPTSVTVDPKAGTVAFTGYRSPSPTLTAYLRLIGLLAPFPDLKALATLTGLPSPLDLTVGPVSFATGDPAHLAVNYQASAPLGSLRVDADTTTTDPTFPVLRAQAIITRLPAALHITGQIGSQTMVDVNDSDPVDAVTAMLTGTSTGYLQASITGIPAIMNFLVDATTNHAEATMSAPLGAITVLAHVPIAGRTFSAFAQVTGVPGHFDADFGNGAYRFRGLSGPLGSATLSVTNHPGATVPTGPHLAVHFNQASGDLDASGSVNGLSEIGFSHVNGNTAIALAMGAATVTFDGDVLLGLANPHVDDTRIAVAGKIATPNNLNITVNHGVFTYKADTSVALLAEIHVGSIALLSGLGAPVFANGLAVRARCAATGCAGTETDQCVCFAAVGTVNLPGLPTQVTVDLAAQHVKVIGYHPVAPLKVFAQVDGFLPAVQHVAALASLSGLPSNLDIDVGPFGFTGGDSSKLDVAYHASAPLGTLHVDAEANTAAFGTLRGLLDIGTIPADIHVTGQFGSHSHIHVADSAPVNHLTVQVTGVLPSGPASGLVSFTDIPATMDFDVHGFGKQALGVPTVNYTASASTLDGLAQVEAKLVEGLSIGGENIPLAGQVFVRITNLGKNTTIVINPDTSVTMTSSPGTTAIQVGGSVDASFPNQTIDLPVFDKLDFQGRVFGHAGAPTIHIGQVVLSIDGLRSLQIKPSDEASYLTTGLDGDYDHFAIDVADVNLVPDVDLTFHVHSPGIIPNFDVVHLVLNAPFTGVNFHRSDETLRQSASFQLDVLGVPTACVKISTLPGRTSVQANHMDVFGSGGPQVLNYIDPIPFPGGLDPVLVNLGIDLLTVYFSAPFKIPAPNADYDMSLGGC